MSQQPNATRPGTSAPKGPGDLPEPLSRRKIEKLSDTDRAKYEIDMRRRKELKNKRRRIDPVPQQGPGAGMGLVENAW